MNLEQRVDRLEKSLRRWRVMFGVATLAAIVASVIAAAPAPRTVEAERFVVKDRAGKVRAEFGVNPKADGGGCTIEIFDATGASIIAVGVDEGGALVGVGDIAAGNSVMLWSSKDKDKGAGASIQRGGQRVWVAPPAK